ncbi:MAG: HAMP domain-containing histidine kinase [Ruminococcaceae bacterium]|nr:HAMP domain-containing histidine kinase [Oscillospiraceae bacterium]
MDQFVQQQLERMTWLSHDLKEPLNTVYSAIQVLQMQDDSEVNQKYCRIAQRHIYRMTRKIDQFTKYYEMVQGGVTLSIKMIDGKNFVESLCSAVQDCFTKQELDLTVEIIGDGLVCLDEFLIEEAFVNLISNGMKATKEKPCKIEVKAVLDEGAMTLSVRDFGCGIPSDDQKTILEPMIQLDNFEQGTGLGLSIVSEVVKRHGGELKIESEPGKGSLFMMKIAFQQPDESDLVQLKQSHPDLERLQRVRMALADLL